jgi:predicted SAM-dependent methyltransferase
VGNGDGGVRINVGCGSDYRDGFVNIDGNPNLPRVDLVLDLPRESLCGHFGPGSARGPVRHVLANDFIEHHTHWEAIGLLRDFFAILAPGGTIELKLPDFEYIAGNAKFSMHQKIMMIFGGQDISQGEADTSHRRNFPQYFCHKHAYTKQTMAEELRQLGFESIEARQNGTNMIVTARKPLAATAAA